MRYFILIVLQIVLSFNVSAAATCEGKIVQLVKWSNNRAHDLSILVEGSNRYIQMEDETFKSLALMAYATQRKVRIRWLADDVVSCTDGWSHYRKLDGYMMLLD